MNGARTAPATEVPPAMQMLQLIAGFWISRCIYITAKLGIADLLRDGPKSADELAAATSTNPAALFRVLRALASVRALTQDDGGKFGNTPVSDTLRSNVPGSLRAFAMTELGEEHYPAWDFFAQNPENAKIFNDAMSGMTAQANEALHAAYSFEGIRKIVDVGGGHGGLITSILQRN